MKPFLVGGIFLLALAVIVWVGVASASIPRVKLRDLRAAYGGGAVCIDDGLVTEIEALAPLRFKVAMEGETADFILVHSERTVPENFKLGRRVGLEGYYDPQTNVFNAYKITTDCPSKYEASREGVAPGEYGQTTAPPPTLERAGSGGSTGVE